jgi:hypothetical protein
VIACAWGDATNKMTSANASGVTHVEKSAFGMSNRLAGVSMMEGSTALTVIRSPLSSSSRLSVNRPYSCPETKSEPAVGLRSRAIVEAQHSSKSLVAPYRQSKCASHGGTL